MHVKALGNGMIVGRKIGVSVLDNEVSVDLLPVASAVTSPDSLVMSIAPPAGLPFFAGSSVDSSAAALAMEDDEDDVDDEPPVREFTL